MKPLCVMSVPHTGTFFTYYMLPGKHAKSDIEAGHKYFAHVTDPTHVRFLNSECEIIVPLRRYDRVQASWIRRKLDVSRLASAWEYALNITGAFFLQIDANDRDQQLTRLSARLGCHLTTDWTLANHLQASV